jgi:hypothetical protein
MGALKSYEKSSPKSGYYIVDHVPGKGFATLQTTGVAERLIDWVEFNSEDRLPQVLVQAMLDVDLLWTGTSSEPPESADEYSLEALDTHAVRTGLSTKQYQRLIAFCERYDGGRREALKELERELSVSGLSLSEDDYPDPESLSEQQNKSETQADYPSQFQGLHKRIFVADQHLPDLVQESIRRWGADVEGILNHPFGPVYAQAFTDYPGNVESVHSSEDQIEVRFQAPHPACLFKEAYAPGPTTDMTFQTADLPDLHYRDVDTETDRHQLFKSAWQAFRIQLQGSSPWENKGKPVVVNADSGESPEGLTTAVRRTDRSSTTSDILHQAAVRDYEITDWETAFDEPDQYKYDTDGRTNPSDLSPSQKLAVREQQLGAYRSITCLEKFLPGFSKPVESGELKVPDPV